MCTRLKFLNIFTCPVTATYIDIETMDIKLLTSSVGLSVGCKEKEA